MAGEVAPPRTPRLGMGTHTLRGESCARAVAAALRCGVRLLDTASIYKNEGEVADGIAAAMAAGACADPAFGEGHASLFCIAPADARRSNFTTECRSYSDAGVHIAGNKGERV